MAGVFREEFSGEIKMNLTLQSLMDEGTEVLSLAGVSEAPLDAKYLLFEAFHTDMVHFLMHRNEEVKDEDSVKRAVADYRKMVKCRSKRIPLQQIIGSREFMGLDFYVNEHVLIPRQDTETLVELVLKDYKGRDPKVLDICTGSGCIGVSLAVLGGFGDVTLADISKKALKVAKKNVSHLMETEFQPVKLVVELISEEPWKLEFCAVLAQGKRRINLLESDLFSAFTGRSDSGFDVIVSNPPYIPSADIESLEPEVRDHEPRLALDGMADGLYFYRKLAAECRRYLKPGGCVYLEIGYDQGQAVSRLLKDNGFREVSVFKDMPGLDRVVRGII